MIKAKDLAIGQVYGSPGYAPWCVTNLETEACGAVSLEYFMWEGTSGTWLEYKTMWVDKEFAFSDSPIQWIGELPPRVKKPSTPPASESVVKRSIPENAKRTYDCVQCHGRTKEVIMARTSVWYCPRCEP